MKKSFLIILSLLLFGQKAIGECVNQICRFSHSDLKCDTIKGVDNRMYNLLSYDELENEGDPGAPSLPIKYISISIPYTAGDISLRVESYNIISKQLTNKIYPRQWDTPTLIGYYEKSFTSCDSVLYNSNLPFPAQNAQIVSISSVRDSERIVKIAVSPVQYYPALNMIEIAEQIEISLDYSVAKNSQVKESSKSGAYDMDIDMPYYEYCIITTQNLKDSFTRLIGWQQEKGLDAGVVCVEEILTNENLVGDISSSLYDDAGKVRQYLQYAYNSGVTKYVLFGGNNQVLPIRYGTGKDNTWNWKEQNDFKIPTDFYFSELFSNWNTDGDQFLGEPNDSLDYGGQLYVGRLLCTTASDVENYTDKLIRYELYPGNGDFSYLKRAFFQQADELQMHPTGGQANYIANALGGNFTTKTIIQEEPGPRSENTLFPNGHEIIDSMKVHYGYVSWFGHGNPNAITTQSNSVYHDGRMDNLYKPYGIISLENCAPYFMPEVGNGLDCLDNKDYPMIAYSVACTITPFDLYNHYTEYPNMGQSFTLGKDYGGPALIGNTRYGWVYYSYLYQKEFNDFVIDYPIGKALVLARKEYCMASPSYYHFLAHASNVIGCPCIRLWTDEPALFSASLSYNSNNYVLTANSSITDAEIGIRDVSVAYGNVTAISFNPSQGPKTLPNAANCLITLTGKNCLPQIMPLTIQNKTMRGTHHLIVKDVTCGRDVRSGTQGNVVFDEDSKFTFETRGTFTLTKGVTVNGELTVYPSEINY